MTEGPLATLIDTNVLLDLLQDDPVWRRWSGDALAAAAERGPLVVNPIIFAELSIDFLSIEEIDESLAGAGIQRAAIPWAAAFLAGKVYTAYRARGGSRRSPLPDFFIGAHAAVSGFGLLTRDARRYRTYFPTVSITAPS